ncbi:uncharacterized protein LOC135332308 isoform X2 [Halichondria panicea]|uniref:uncharacterized protein LOC135332308 isoform X2 n=1 Tax=Halichondria panicea TaxID=6063 RepID=UPI00312B8333
MENKLYFIVVIVCLLQLSTSVILQDTQAAEATTVECQESEYRVMEGQSVQVCLQFTGPLSIDEDEENLFVVANVFTQPITADVSDFGATNLSSIMTFSMTFSPNTRGLFSLPCVEVVSRMGDVREGVRVVIAQQKPHESLRNCTVYIRDKGETTTSGSTEVSSTGGIPQSQGTVGAIAGGVVGTLIGLVGITVAIVTLVVMFCCCHLKDKNLDSDKCRPKPVVYKRSDSSGSEVGVVTPTRRGELVAVPMDNPVYNEEMQGYVAEDPPPSSPIYSNVSHETLPEDYEIPLPLTNQNSVDQTALPYEVPLTSRSNSNDSAGASGVDHMYHTLETPRKI